MNTAENIRKKVCSREKLDAELRRWRLFDKKIVFTNGCFDILHPGHIDYLSKAADMGDVLIIGVNTDDSVKKLKGPHRPINDEHARAMLLASLHMVDAVILFEEDTPYDLIKHIQPDVLVKGGDYKPEQIAGYDIVTKKGGAVVTVDFLPGYSTTTIERKIKEA